jgi:hypothetical protein
VTPQVLAEQRERETLEKEEKDRLQAAVDEANDPWRIRAPPQQPSSTTEPAGATASTAATTSAMGLAARAGGSTLSGSGETKATGPVVVGHDEKLCTTCNRAVPTRTFTMHSLQCARAQQRAAAQPSATPTTATTAPVAPTTRPVTCLLCTKHLGTVSLTADADTIADDEADLRQSHNPTCDRRPVCCQICKKFFPLIDFKQHEETCGGRMEKCLDCGKDVPLRELFTFNSSTPAYVSPPPLLIPWPLGSHSSICVPKQETCPACKSTMPLRTFAHHKSSVCPHRSEECPFCFLIFPLQHQEYCGSRTAPCDTCGRYVTLRIMPAHLRSNCTFPAAPTPSSSNSNSNNQLDNSVEMSPRSLEEKDRRLALMLSLGLDRSPPAGRPTISADAAPGGHRRIYSGDGGGNGDGSDSDQILRDMRARVDALERAAHQREHDLERQRIDLDMAQDDPDLFSALMASAAPPNGSGSGAGAPISSAHAQRLADRLAEENKLHEMKRTNSNSNSNSNRNAPAATRTTGAAATTSTSLASRGRSTSAEIRELLRERELREQLETEQVLMEQRERDRRAAVAAAGGSGATSLISRPLPTTADRVREAREAASAASRVGARTNALAQPSPVVATSIGSTSGRLSPSIAGRRLSPATRTSPGRGSGASRASPPIDLPDSDDDSDEVVLRRAIAMSRADAASNPRNRASPSPSSSSSSGTSLVASTAGRGTTRTNDAAATVHPSGMPRRSPPPSSTTTTGTSAAGLRRRPAAAAVTSSASSITPAAPVSVTPIPAAVLNPSRSFATIPPAAAGGTNECPHCGANTGTYEDLQMHVFTACPVFLHLNPSPPVPAATATRTVPSTSTTAATTLAAMGMPGAAPRAVPVTSSSGPSAAARRPAAQPSVTSSTIGSGSVGHRRIVDLTGSDDDDHSDISDDNDEDDDDDDDDDDDMHDDHHRRVQVASIRRTGGGPTTAATATRRAGPSSSSTSSSMLSSMQQLRSPTAAPSVSGALPAGYYTSAMTAPPSSSVLPSSTRSTTTSTRATAAPSSSSAPSYPSSFPYSIIPSTHHHGGSAVTSPNTAARFNFPASAEVMTAGRGIGSRPSAPRVAERNVGGRGSSSNNNPFDSPTLGSDGGMYSMSGNNNGGSSLAAASLRRGRSDDNNTYSSGSSSISAAGGGSSAARALSDNPYSNNNSSTSSSNATRMSRFSFEDDLDREPTRMAAPSSTLATTATRSSSITNPPVASSSLSYASMDPYGTDDRATATRAPKQRSSVATTGSSGSERGATRSR